MFDGVDSDDGDEFNRRKDLGHYILNARGEPERCDLMTWAHWLGAHDDERIIRRDRINGILISSVFLGLDHRFSGTGPPILWEHAIVGYYAQSDWVISRFASKHALIRAHEQNLRRIDRAVRKKRRVWHMRTKDGLRAWRAKDC